MLLFEEDVMIQLDDTQPSATPLSRELHNWPQDGRANEAQPETGQTTGEDGGLRLFVSPPPAPFPRVFPGL
jgi:hypothetical protein